MTTHKETDYLCIGCPLGCHLTVVEEGDEIVKVRGIGCKKGDAFARQEHTDPRRMVTTSVMVEGGLWSRLPVKTSAEVPKGRVLELCQSLRHVTVSAPCRLGQVVMANVLGLGVDMVATRDMPSVHRD